MCNCSFVEEIKSKSKLPEISLSFPSAEVERQNAEAANRKWVEKIVRQPTTVVKFTHLTGIAARELRLFIVGEGKKNQSFPRPAVQCQYETILQAYIVGMFCHFCPS